LGAVLLMLYIYCSIKSDDNSSSSRSRSREEPLISLSREEIIPSIWRVGDMVVLRPGLGARHGSGDDGAWTLNPGELARVGNTFRRTGEVMLERARDGMEMRYFAQTDLCAAPANEHQPETSSNPTGSIYHPQLMQPMQPAASMLTPMASVVVETPQTLDALLTAASLDHVRAPLMDLGVVEVADFADVTDKDLQDCGLKTIEIKRLRRHLAS
jgi:hypothetical protein